MQVPGFIATEQRQWRLRFSAPKRTKTDRSLNRGSNYGLLNSQIVLNRGQFKIESIYAVRLYRLEKGRVQSNDNRVPKKEISKQTEENDMERLWLSKTHEMVPVHRIYTTSNGLKLSGCKKADHNNGGNDTKDAKEPT